MTTSAEVTVGRGRLVAGAFLGLAAGMVAMASLDAMLVPIQNDFVLSVDNINLLVLSVSTGALLVLFAVGGLVDRIGPLRIIALGAVGVSLGAVLVSLAQGIPMLMGGRMVGGVGGTAMGVASMALLNEAFTDNRERAWIFGLFAAVTGLTFAVSPVISGVICNALTWRAVPVLWIACAAGAVALTRGAPLPDPREARAPREMVTPWSAGLCLASLSLAALLVNQGVAYAATALAVSGASLTVLLLRWRWLRSHGRSPGLDASVFRSPGAKALAGAMLAIGAINLVFYANLFLQYRLGLTPTEVAVILLLPQVSGIAGGLLGGWMGARWGSTLTTAIALAAGCLAAASFFAVSEDSTVWLVVALLTAFTLPGGCVTGSLTKAFLDCAEPAASGAAASWRQAGWSLGTTLGGVAGGAVILSYFTHTWASTLVAAGVDVDTARWAAESVRGGVPLTQIAANATLQGVPAKDVVQNFVGLPAAQIGTLHVIALLGAVAYATSLGFVLLAMWRQRVAAHG